MSLSERYKGGASYKTEENGPNSLVKKAFTKPVPCRTDEPGEGRGGNAECNRHKFLYFFHIAHTNRLHLFKKLGQSITNTVTPCPWTVSRQSDLLEALGIVHHSDDRGQGSGRPAQ